MTSKNIWNYWNPWNYWNAFLVRFQTFQMFQSFQPPPLFLPRDAGDKGGGLNPSAEFILSGVEGLRTGSAQRLNDLNGLNAD